MFCDAGGRCQGLLSNLNSLWSPQVTLIVLAALAITINGKPAPNAEPKAFFGAGLGAIALPALTNSALIDGLLLGKVAFLKGGQQQQQQHKQQRQSSGTEGSGRPAS